MTTEPEIEDWETASPEPAAPLTSAVSPLHEAARRYAQAGTPVLPCWPGSKRPIPAHGLLERSRDLAQVDEWWRAHPDANVAICPDDAGLAVIDIDGAEGAATWAASEGGPATCTVRTPSGGRHLYFRGQLPPTVAKIGPGVDTRGERSFVLVPPSRIDDRNDKARGKPWKQGVYALELDLPEAQLPPWLIEAAGRMHEAAAAAEGFELDLAVNVARATAWLHDRAPAVEGQGGDNWTYQTFATLFDLGLSIGKALEIAADWNASCDPPWELEELHQKAESASVNRQNAVGAWAVAPPSQTFASALDKLGVVLTEGPRAPQSFADLLARDVPPIRELVPGLIERGVVTFLSAPGGSHKSRLAVQLGLAIQAGQPIFGRRTDEPATFVYVSYEDSADEVARRVQKIAKRLNLPADIGGRYFDKAGQFDPLAVISESEDPELRPFWTELHDALAAIPGHKFVVLDGTYNALHFRGAAKINEAAVYGAIALLQRLADETDSSIVALWHPSVAGQERGDASGWSVAWNNAPRARLSLVAGKSEDTYELRVEKRNHGPKGQPLTLHFDNGALLPRSEIAQADHETRFLEACVAAAIQAAETDQPIQKQRTPAKWVFDEVEKACGFRPNKTELKDALARAMLGGRLRYVSGNKDRMAGYYPMDHARAAELAAAAKDRAGQRGGSDA